VQFNTPGTYTVSFTVSDALGLADPTPATRTVTVANPGVGVIPQSAWSLVSVDSQETIGENGQAVNAFDGNPASLWHTAWYQGNPPPPHEIQINLGATYTLSGFRYLPRQDGSVNGTIAQYEFYVSASGPPYNWVLVASGTFATGQTEKEVAFAAVAGRYVRLRALSEVNGSPWTSVAELNVLGTVAP
jgi:PKD repeat protein